MPSTISGSQIAAANLLIGGTYLSDTISTINSKVSNNYLQAQNYGTGDVSNTYLQAQGYGTGDVSNTYLQAQSYGNVSNNYLQAQSYGNVSNNYSTSTYVSNTYFQDNSSSVHALKLEGIVSSTQTFSAGQQILTSTYYRETGLGFNVGSISWNGSTGQVTVPEAGIYFVSHSMYNQGGSQARYYINVNGTVHALHHVTGSDEDGTRTFTDILNLSANDVVTVTNVYANAQSYMGTIHTWFNIYKIG